MPKTRGRARGSTEPPKRPPRNPETVAKIKAILARSGWPKPERVPAVMREPGEEG